MSETVEVLISKEEIENRLNELATQIINDFDGKTITMVGILKGAVIFMTDLAKKLDTTVEFDFMQISSYADSTKSSGVIKIVKDLDNPITGKDVLLIEDIVDTGRTLEHLIKHLKAQRPNSIRICTLLDKPDRRVIKNVVTNYSGFVIPDEFVVGYGLDYAQRYRNLPYIGILKID